MVYGRSGSTEVIIDFDDRNRVLREMCGDLIFNKKTTSRMGNGFTHTWPSLHMYDKIYVIFFSHRIIKLTGIG